MSLPPCEQCGKPARGPRSRLCETCRKREQRGARVIPIAEKQEPQGPLGKAALAELEEAGRSESLLGQQVLDMAVRLDTGAVTGSAAAALHRELRATMEAALAASQAASPVDELRRKRLERIASGG